MDIKTNIGLVVARYKENIDWISKIQCHNIYIYDKFSDKNISLPNIGREAHTYLYHIISNYHNLNDYNIFLQGNPFPHCPNLYSQINNLSYNNINDIIALNKIETETESTIHRKVPIHPHGLFLAYFMDLLFGIKLDKEQTIKVTYGAQFVCTKKAIINRPLDFYKFLLNFVSYETHPVEAYIFERLWLYIFDTKINISDKYKLWMKKNEQT